MPWVLLRGSRRVALRCTSPKSFVGQGSNLLQVGKRVGNGCRFYGSDCDLRTKYHDQRMGTRGRSSTPDLFSSEPTREGHSRSSESSGSSPAITSIGRIPSRHVLPTDLPNTVRHLDERELEQLLSAVIAEHKRRGKKLPSEISRKRRVQMVAVAGKASARPELENSQPRPKAHKDRKFIVEPHFAGRKSLM